MKRAGKTETLSISLAAGPLKILRRRAKESYRGNVSAAIAEAAEFLRRDMAMGELVDELTRKHGPLTDEDRTAMAVELRGEKPTRHKRKRAA